MNNFLKNCISLSCTLITTAFMFLPENIFTKCLLFSNVCNEINIIINRILFSLFITIVSTTFYKLYLHFRKKYKINGHTYIIQIEYGDILSIKDCKLVIPFDECYNSKVGSLPSDIKPTSICGQYLKNNTKIDINALINNIHLKPSKTKSKYQNRTRYESGKLVPNGNELLMAFAKLDKNGLGTFFSYSEYIDCLSILWKEIDKYYEQSDVCIPILGSGLTRIKENCFTQQELLDIMIMSYKLSPYKIKKPYKLRIICKKNDDFSLNKINATI